MGKLSVLSGRDPDRHIPWCIGAPTILCGAMAQTYTRGSLLLGFTIVGLFVAVAMAGVAWWFAPQFTFSSQTSAALVSGLVGLLLGFDGFLAAAISRGRFGSLLPQHPVLSSTLNFVGPPAYSAITVAAICVTLATFWSAP